MNDVMMEVINNNMNTKYYYKIKKMNRTEQ